MPKLRETEQQKREKALMVAIARSSAELGLSCDKEIAELLDISPQSYGQYKKKNFQTPGFELFCKMARRLKLTGPEVCAVIGVPYTNSGGGTAAN